MEIPQSGGRQTFEGALAGLDDSDFVAFGFQVETKTIGQVRSSSTMRMRLQHVAQIITSGTSISPRLKAIRKLAHARIEARAGALHDDVARFERRRRLTVRAGRW